MIARSLKLLMRLAPKPERKCLLFPSPLTAFSRVAPLQLREENLKVMTLILLTISDFKPLFGSRAI